MIYTTSCIDTPLTCTNYIIHIPLVSDTPLSDSGLSHWNVLYHSESKHSTHLPLVLLKREKGLNIFQKYFSINMKSK